MKLDFKLAYKNLIRAGLKTWLNSLALSFAFVLILFYNGMIDGWNNEARRDAIEWDYGYGHLRNAAYNPNDPFTIQDGHDVLPAEYSENLTPVLIWQGNIYPQGRSINVLVKGILPDQSTLKIPGKIFKNTHAEYPALIGARMAESAHLKEGDLVQLRWRDKNGTFDAVQITIAGIFNTNVPFVDGGQIWMPYGILNKMLGTENNATYFIANNQYVPEKVAGWTFVTQEELLKPISNLINAKKYGASVMYLLLLAIGLLVIFDTLALSIFRRQREIGTHIALGETQRQVVRMFTIEGIMYSVFGMVLGAIYGTPLFIYLAREGISFPVSGESMGIILAPTIYSVYSIELILKTILLLIISTALVSRLAARKIVKMNPVEALKGKAL